MGRNTTKTPAQLVSELQNRIAGIQAREAKQLASDNPFVAQLVDTLDSYRKDIAAISRQTNGPQSFANRRQGFELRLVEINAGEELAKAQDADYRAASDYLKAQIQTFSDRVKNGETLTNEDVQTVLNGRPATNPDLPALQEAFNVAHAASKAFIASKKAETPATEVQAEATTPAVG